MSTRTSLDQAVTSDPPMLAGPCVSGDTSVEGIEEIGQASGEQAGRVARVGEADLVDPVGVRHEQGTNLGQAQNVTARQQIGAVGSNGNSTGPHLN